MLNKLIDEYQQTIVKNADGKNINIDNFHKKRHATYAKLNTGMESVAVEESKAFLDLVKHVLFNANYPPSQYIKTLEYMSKVIPNNANEVMTKEILKYEHETLNQVFRDLKKHPMQAGIRVRFVKDARAEVKTSLEKLEVVESTQILSK